MPRQQLDGLGDLVRSHQMECLTEIDRIVMARQDALAREQVVIQSVDRLTSPRAENEAGDDQARENGREEEQGRW